MRSCGSRVAALALLVSLPCCRLSAEQKEATLAAPSSDAGASLVGLTIRVGDQSGLTRSILDSAGELETPYHIDWSVFTAGPPMMEALAADAIDIGACGDTPPLFALAGGAQVRIVGALRAAPDYVALLAPAGSKVARMADLRGKRVAVARGSSAHHLLLAALNREGMTMADIRPVYLTPNDAQPAFTHGDVDAWAIWDPFATNNLRQGALKVTDGRGLTHGLAFEVTTATALADAAKARVIADYLARLARAEAWGDAHPDAWAAKYAVITKLEPELTRAVLAHYRPRFVAIDAALEAEEQDVEDTFAAAGVLSTRLDVKPIFDARYNDAIAPFMSAPSETIGKTP